MQSLQSFLLLYINWTLTISLKGMDIINKSLFTSCKPEVKCSTWYLTCEILCWRLEEKFHVSTNTCIILYVQPTLFNVYLSALSCSKGYLNFHHKKQSIFTKLYIIIVIIINLPFTHCHTVDCLEEPPLPFQKHSEFSFHFGSPCS